MGISFCWCGKFIKMTVFITILSTS
jgi:hypothetical protein